MRTTHVTVSLALLGTLFAMPADASSVLNFSTSGTQTSLDTGTTDSTGCVTIFVSLMPITSITRLDGSKSSGSVATGDVQLFNTCTGISEFGSIFTDVGSAFSAGPLSATLTATIVVEMAQFDADFNLVGFVDRTLVASGLTWTAITQETFVARSHTRQTFPGTKSVSNGHSTEHVATVTGALSVDGQDVLIPGAFALFETSASSSVTLTTTH